MPTLNLSYTEHDLIRLIIDDISNKTNVVLNERDVMIMVKSSQNYKSEWEKAAFKAEAHVLI